MPDSLDLDTIESDLARLPGGIDLVARLVHHIPALVARVRELEAELARWENLRLEVLADRGGCGFGSSFAKGGTPGWVWRGWDENLGPAPDGWRHVNYGYVHRGCDGWDRWNGPPSGYAHIPHRGSPCRGWWTWQPPVSWPIPEGFTIQRSWPSARAAMLAIDEAMRAADLARAGGAK